MLHLLVTITAATLATAPDPLAFDTFVVLSNEVTMPAVGFGTAGGIDSAAIVRALASGYVAIDSAMAPEWYDESAAAAAIHASGLQRHEVFVTTKLHARHHGNVSAERRVRASAALFDGYIDLLLLHHPECWLPMCDPAAVEGTWQDSWRVLERALHATPPLARAIGVSNFEAWRLRELLDRVATKLAPPMVVQNWMDPLHQDREVRALCAARGVAYTAYSTLGAQHTMRSGGGPNPVLTSPTLLTIGDAHGKSAAQVALRWALQSGAMVIPRTRSAARLVENREGLDFELSAEEVSTINVLDGGTDGGAAAAAAAAAEAREEL